jgi:N-ethylmaleimide reductase
MLFTPLASPSLPLRNRIAMAPMTRSRAVEANTPNALMAKYYGQRATAGLVVTEGTSPSPNGLGYARIPGLFNEAHVQGWKQVTQAVTRPGRQGLRAADAHGARRPRRQLGRRG